MKKLILPAVIFSITQLIFTSILQAQTKSCYVWVNDHWERPRANKKYHPDSLVCITPGQPMPNGPVVRDHRNEPVNTQIIINETTTEKNFTIRHLGKQSSEDISTWNTAVTKQLGIIGSDYNGKENIGSACFERAAEAIYIPNNLNFWYPQHRPSEANAAIKFYKRTLIGIIDGRQKPEVQNINEQYNDYDINIHILPNPDYTYLITDAHKPEMSTKQWIKEVASNASIKHPWVTYIDGCPNKFVTVEAEVDSKKAVNDRLNTLVNGRLNKQIGVYGPWIWDEGHCHQPEIHPSEQVWWNDIVNNQKIYTLNLFCDASKRYWWRHQMDDGTKPKPWGAPPIKGTFAIAFEVNIGNGITANSGEQKIYEVSNIDHYNVKEYPGTDKTYNLVHEGKNIVSFMPHNNAFKVSFEKVGVVEVADNRRPNVARIIKGFIVLETEVGTCSLKNNGKIFDPIRQVLVTLSPETNPNSVPEYLEEAAFQKVEGHYMFKVTEVVKKNTPVVSGVSQ